MNHMDERNKTGGVYRKAEQQRLLDEDDLGLFMHLGIESGNLTQNQIDTILIPSHAPENYMCDGEISSKEAEVRWRNQLVQSGLHVSVIKKAMRLVR